MVFFLACGDLRTEIELRILDHLCHLFGSVEQPATAR